MNMALLKMTLKKNWVLIAIFYGILTMYLSVMISMFDPEEVNKLLEMVEMFPENLMKAMGFTSIATTLTAYLASWLYGMLMLGLPMVYCIILGNRLVAKMVDNNSIAYLLSTPNSRSRIIITRGVYAILSLILLFAAVTATGVLLSEAIYPGLLDIAAFIKLNIITAMVNMVVMMISFFFSCLFNEAKYSSLLGAGVPIIFLLMNMLSGVSDKIEYLKRFTIYGLFDPVGVINGETVWQAQLIYAAIIAVLFSSAVLIFNKKRLPI